MGFVGGFVDHTNNRICHPISRLLEKKEHLVLDGGMDGLSSPCFCGISVRKNSFITLQTNVSARTVYRLYGVKKNPIVVDNIVPGFTDKTPGPSSKSLENIFSMDVSLLVRFRAPSSHKQRGELIDVGFSGLTDGDICFRPCLPERTGQIFTAKECQTQLSHGGEGHYHCFPKQEMEALIAYYFDCPPVIPAQ